MRVESPPDVVGHSGNDFVDLAILLLRCSDPGSALRLAVETLHRLTGAGAAGVTRQIGRIPPQAHVVGISAGRASLQHRLRSAAIRSIPGQVLDVPDGALGNFGIDPEIVHGENVALISLDPSPSGAWLSKLVSLLDAALEQMAPRSADRYERMMGIAWTAHELREPLVGVSAALERVIEEPDGLTTTDFLSRSQRELARLSELVDPLLRWSAEPGYLDVREVDLVQLVRDAVESASLWLAAGRVVIADSGAVTAMVDPPQMRAAVANLVRNALAYSPITAEVIVTVTQADDRVLVSVLDGGPGVDEAERDLLFEPFVRGSVGRESRLGSGLGLYITKTIVEAHRGTLTFRPWAGGAIFSIDLPLRVRELETCAS